MAKTSSTGNKSKLSSQQSTELITTLKSRFEKNMTRHQGLEWAKVQARLEGNPEKLWSLHEMERTGGEPDVVVTTRRLANTFFTIVRRKVRKAVEVFVTTARRSMPGKNISPKILP